MKNDISKEMYIELIDTFMPSECMKEYMKGEGSIINNERLLSELIIYSPVALQTKREWLDKLRAFCTNVSDGLFEEVYTAINEAWVELTKASENDYLWIIEDCWYDYDIHEQKEIFVGVCGSYESMIRFIKSERADEREYVDDGEVGETWFRINLMQRNVKTGKYEHLYRFYEVNEEICFFEEMQFYRKNVSKRQNGYFRENMPFDFKHALGPSISFNPLKPFKPGDILEVNYGPFAPKINVVVLESDDDWNDDSYPTVLVKREHDKDEPWDTASLQGTLPIVALQYADVISPLFFTEKKETLPPGMDNEILLQVSNLIKKDNLLGQTLWDDINEAGCDFFTGEDLRNWVSRHQSVN